MDIRVNSLAARDIATLVHPQTNLQKHQEEGPVIQASGKGIRLVDEEGREYLDAMSGLWCASLGYAPERLASAAYEQMQKLSYGHLYKHRSHEPAIDLAEKLLSIAPKGMAKVHFQNSGSEANDVAVKLVWYYHHAIGKPEKRKIISRLGAYHGSSVATGSLTGKPDMHAEFNLPIGGFLHTDCPYFFRDAEEGESEEDYATRLADSLDTLIEQEGPETVAAFFAEPVLGSSGAIPPPKTYFEKVHKVLKKHEVLFVVDEVITGFGRTGYMWGSERYNLQPDIVTCAKALSAGALPISALMMSDRVYQAMVSQSEKLGNYAHGHTYAGHPACAAVALETLRIYEEMDLIGTARSLGDKLEGILSKVADHPLVAQIDVTGFMAGIELQAEDNSQSPSLASSAEAAARDQGLILKSIGSRVVFAPAFVSTRGDLAEMGEKFAKALDAVHADLHA